MTDRAIVNFVLKKLKEKTPKESIAQLLTKYSIKERGSSDNVSIIILYLDNKL